MADAHERDGAARLVTNAGPGTLKTVEDLSCQDFVELVTDYLEGALPPDERARFEAHIAACRGCERYLEQMRTTIAVSRATADLEARPEVAALLAAFRDWNRRP
jgi:anti-sigma factor RsiW